MKRVLIKDLQQELIIVKQHRDEWRDKYYKKECENLELKKWIQSKFDWWIELISQGQTPCLKYLIKDTAKILGMKIY